MSDSINLRSPTTTLSPEKTLTIYNHAKHRVTFSPASSAPAEYTVVKTNSSSCSSWSPLFYRGCSASSPPEIPVIGSGQRNAFWAKLSLELGDGVGQVVQNREAEKLRAIEARKRWWRWLFRMKERPVREIQDVEISGLVLAVFVKRRPRLGRAMKWEFDGVEYVWTGTRSMARSVLKGVKGCSHDMKLTRTCDHALIATYEKKHFGRREGSGVSKKDKKRSIGTLRIYPAAYEPLQPATQHTKGGADPKPFQELKVAPKHQTGRNITGTHTGNIFEESVVMTCWAAMEAEHRIRHAILDILISIAENAGG